MAALSGQTASPGASSSTITRGYQATSSTSSTSTPQVTMSSPLVYGTTFTSVYPVTVTQYGAGNWPYTTISYRTWVFHDGTANVFVPAPSASSASGSGSGFNHSSGSGYSSIANQSSGSVHSSYTSGDLAQGSRHGGPGSGSSGGLSKWAKSAIIAGSTIMTLMVCGLVICCCLRRRRRRRTRKAELERRLGDGDDAGAGASTSAGQMRQIPSRVSGVGFGRTDTRRGMVTVAPGRAFGGDLTTEEVRDAVAFLPSDPSHSPAHPPPLPPRRYTPYNPDLDMVSDLALGAGAGAGPSTSRSQPRIPSIIGSSRWGSDDSEYDMLATDGSSVTRSLSTRSAGDRTDPERSTLRDFDSIPDRDDDQVDSDTVNPFDHPAYTTRRLPSQRQRGNPSTATARSPTLPVVPRPERSVPPLTGRWDQIIVDGDGDGDQRRSRAGYSPHQSYSAVHGMEPGSMTYTSGSSPISPSPLTPQTDPSSSWHQYRHLAIPTRGQGQYQDQYHQGHSHQSYGTNSASISPITPTTSSTLAPTSTTSTTPTTYGSHSHSRSRPESIISESTERSERSERSDEDNHSIFLSNIGIRRGTTFIRHADSESGSGTVVPPAVEGYREGRKRKEVHLPPRYGEVYGDLA